MLEFEWGQNGGCLKKKLLNFSWKGFLLSKLSSSTRSSEIEPISDDVVDDITLTKIPHEHVPKSHVNTCDYICDHMWFWNMFMWNFCKRSLDNKRPSKRFLKSFFSLNIRSFGLIRTLPYSLFSYQVFYFIDWLTAAPCTLQAGWNLYMGDFKKS